MRLNKELTIQDKDCPCIVSSDVVWVHGWRYHQVFYSVAVHIRWQQHAVKLTEIKTQIIDQWEREAAVNKRGAQLQSAKAIEQGIRAQTFK